MLAGGCFWGVEEILRGVPGVIDTDVGYTGGWLENPTYDDTHDSKSGHAEAIRVTFDPSVLSYEDLLEQWFFKLHDPTTLNRQGNDVGTQYRSAIFPQTPEQKAHGGAGEGAGRGVGQVEAADHDDDRARLHLVQRRGVPPGLPAEASRRVQLPLPAGLAPAGGGVRGAEPPQPSSQSIPSHGMRGRGGLPDPDVRSQDDHERSREQPHRQKEHHRLGRPDEGREFHHVTALGFPEIRPDEGRRRAESVGERWPNGVKRISSGPASP